MRRHPAFETVAHRPWPHPEAAWTWRQTWHDLLFCHWPVPVASLRPLVPAALEIETFHGSAWIGVVPFRMSGVMRRGMPDLPFLSAFPELNVRTYVRHRERPGVWFLSLDATNPLAVWAARRFWHLPYFRARIVCRREGEAVRYRLRRRGAAFSARYRPVGAVEPAAAGSLAHFLTERYALYARAHDGRLIRNEVHHAPWPLRAAEAELEEEGMLAFHGIARPEAPAILHHAERLDVVVWPGEVVETATGSGLAAPRAGRIRRRSDSC